LLAALAVVAVVLLVAMIVRPGSQGGPPPLRLTSGAGAAGGVALAAQDSTSEGRGWAPYGGDYQVEGPLPEGPDSARVYRPTASATKEWIAKLADALGLDGTVRRDGANWIVRDGAATLRVSTGPGNPWTFVREEGASCLPMPVDPSAGRDSAVSCTAVGVASPAAGANDDAVSPPTAPVRPPTSASTPPQPPTVSGNDALRAADPVLAAVGLDAPAEAPPAAPVVTVTVDPTVAGLRTSGVATEVSVDSQGVAWAHGWLGGTREGAAYPLVSAAKAIDQLKGGPEPAIAIDCPMPAPMEVAPDGSKVDVAPSCPAAKPTVIVGADLGLSLQWDADGPVLVPAWLFQVRGWEQPLALIAVQPRYLGEPPAVDPDGGASVGSGSSGGSTGSAGSPGSTGAGVGSVEPAPPVTKPSAVPATPVPERTSDPNAVPATPPMWDSWNLVNPTTIRVQLTAGPADGTCGTTLQGMAKETEAEVYVLVLPHQDATSNVKCDQPSVTRTVDVALAAPLGDRVVYDATSGQLRPRR
jgi:hypothetical protein